MSSLRTASSRALASARSVAVAGHVAGVQQRDAVAHRLELAAPVVRRAASLHYDLRGLVLREEGVHAATRKALARVDAPRRVRYRDLEDGLCQVDTDARSVHADSFSTFGLRGREVMCWHAGAAVGEESIPSLNLTRKIERS
jgi:hypothetical protein